MCLKTKELFRNRNIIIKTAVAFGGITMAIRYSDECYRGMEKGIGFCLEVLIPSLFFFMVIAAYIVQSGICEILCRPLRGISEKLFHLPHEATAVILLSVIGGYPVGASCAATMAKQGRLSASQAAKVAYIAVAAGPGFLINFVGTALLGSPGTGYVLLGAQIFAVILTGVIVGHTVKSEPLAYSSAKRFQNGNLLVSAVQNASRAAFGMCAMVVIFCALSEVMDVVIPSEAICDIASAILEITNGCHRTCGMLPLYITAFFVGFGGLSVHFQIFSILGEVPVKKHLFFLFRIIEGIIAALATYIYLMVMPVTTTVFNSVEVTPTIGRYATLAGSAALVLSSLLFIGSITNQAVLKSRTNRR